MLIENSTTGNTSRLGNKVWQTNTQTPDTVYPEQLSSKMLRRITEGLPLPPPMATVTVVVMIVLQHAHVTTLLQKLTHEELVMSVIANQVAILRAMNESSSQCTCGESLASNIEG